MGEMDRKFQPSLMNLRLVYYYHLYVKADSIQTFILLICECSSSQGLVLGLYYSIYKWDVIMLIIFKYCFLKYIHNTIVHMLTLYKCTVMWHQVTEIKMQLIGWIRYRFERLRSIILKEIQVDAHFTLSDMTLSQQCISSQLQSRR